MPFEAALILAFMIIVASIVLVGSMFESRRRERIARWHGNWSPGINGAILAMGLPKGKESLGDAMLEGDGFLAKMALPSDRKRPWILLRPKAVSLARLDILRDVNEVEQFVRAGVSLTRAFRFGHR